MAWRSGLVGRFVFNPSMPLNPQDVAALKLRLSKKRQDIELKLRTSATSLKQASINSIDQRKKLAQAAEQTLRGLRQAELDERMATGPIYLASRVGPFCIAGAAAFFLSQSYPSTTSASSQFDIAPQSHLAVSPPVTTTPVPMPQVRRSPPADAIGAARSIQNGAPLSLPSGATLGNSKLADASQTQDVPKISNAIGAAVQSYPTVPPSVAPINGPAVLAPILPPPESIASFPGPGDALQAPATQTQSTPSKPTLDPSRTPDAIQIQNRLINLSYLIGPADGKWGPNSKRAIEEFRSRNGISSADQWDEKTEILLFGSEQQVSSVVSALFEGAWTPEPGVCGDAGDAPPLKLTVHTAVTSSGDRLYIRPFANSGKQFVAHDGKMQS